MKDLSGYLSRMEKAMVEKLYFLEQINLNEYDYVIDFGCANGALLKAIVSLSSRVQFVGVDNNRESLKIAQLALQQENVIFFESLKQAFNVVENNKKVVIILSSVLHELPKKVLKEVLSFSKNIDTVIIRDMFFDDEKNKVLKNSLSILQNCKLVEEYQIKQFVKCHGKINNLRALYHFFLKYTYKDNWQTEVKENYFSVPWKKLNKHFTKNGFKILYSKDYILNFKNNEILQNFNFELKHPTHKNIIYKK